MNGDDRSRLRTPIAVILSAVWGMSAVQAAMTGEVELFVIASAPFGILVGYLFGSGIVRRRDEE